MIALTRECSPFLNQCELTHLNRIPINIGKANQQHRQYERALEQMGFTVRRLPETPHLPDGVFVEDTAVVLPDIAVITRPGADSRREETETMADVLKEYRQLHFIEAPGTLDGGDILTLGKKVYIGHTERSNFEGILQFRDIVSHFGYEVTSVPVTGCLHLKSGVSALGEGRLLMNPDWIHPDYFEGFSLEYVPADEPYGANVICYKNVALCAAGFTQTQSLLQQLGFDVITTDQSELAKAEAGLTCCSVIIED